MTTKPIPLSLRKKSSARVAAVQCLYQMRVTGEHPTPEALLTNYLEHWQADHDGKDRAFSKEAEPDKSLLRKLLNSVEEHADAIDALIRASLTEKWTVERMSPLLLSILSCALAELRFLNTLNPAIVIDEYVTLTGRFFETAEMGFVNGLLDTLATPTGEKASGEKHG